MVPELLPKPTAQQIEPKKPTRSSNRKVKVNSYLCESCCNKMKDENLKKQTVSTPNAKLTCSHDQTKHLKQRSKSFNFSSGNDKDKVIVEQNIGENVSKNTKADTKAKCNKLLQKVGQFENEKHYKSVSQLYCEYNISLIRSLKIIFFYFSKI